MSLAGPAAASACGTESWWTNRAGCPKPPHKGGRQLVRVQLNPGSAITTLCAIRFNDRMFQLRYAAQEVWRRGGRTALTALGLAAGVGLVIGIVGISKGLDQAQGQVLSPLKAVGTDILVTRVVGAGPATAEEAPPTTAAADPNAASDDQ